jgi:hypothetical protein
MSLWYVAVRLVSKNEFVAVIDRCEFGDDRQRGYHGIYGYDMLMFNV